MKKWLLLIFLSLSITAFSQTASISQPVVLNFKTYGYIDGKRLDSIDAQYAEVALTSGDEVSFNYGQKEGKRKDLFIADSKGTPFWFYSRERAFLLNFLYYNGWRLAKSNNSAESYGKILLEKR